MPDSTPNGRVSLREFFEQRFDQLDSKLDTYCLRQQLINQDVEGRLRSLERQSPWRSVVETITGIIAVIAVALGIRQP